MRRFTVFKFADGYAISCNSSESAVSIFIATGLTQGDADQACARLNAVLDDLTMELAMDDFAANKNLIMSSEPVRGTAPPDTPPRPPLPPT